MSFFEHLRNTAIRNESLLCVGLDPRPERFPPEIQAQSDPIFAFTRQIIDATRDLVCAYKPNYAFYEAHGIDGLRALRQTIEYIGGEVPVILDAKRGDIGSTAEAYARAAFDVWGADAVTVHPYLGGDALAPFLAYADRGVFVLCHTSNPGAVDLQTLECGGHPLYVRVAQLAQRWNVAGNIGLVIGATYPDALRAVREAAPQMWFLVPGIGAQGGNLEATMGAGLRADGLGIIVNASRSICHAPDPRAAAMELRGRINAARKAATTAAPPPSKDESLILDLARIGAVRFGEFTLKSGAISPIYIDLRLLPSHPPLLHRVALAYADLLRDLPGDRLAAIPYAALPIGTAVALLTGRPLIYPRKEIKGYGTKRAIEGKFQPGERVIVLDDLITTGDSKVEAIAPLREAGLEVKDVVVLIDREGNGRESLARAECRLHAVFTLRHMLDVLKKHGLVSGERYAQVLKWLS